MARAFQFLKSDGTSSFGGWCSTPGTLPAEVMARAGFDWICIDCQHGLIDYREMCSMLVVAEACGSPALVRVSWNSPSEIMRALDAGASAVIVPMVNTAAEARAAASAVRYAPEGSRSWGPIRAALEHSNWRPRDSNRLPRCLAQIETNEAMSNLEDILATPGIDGIYVGPADLALDYGIEPSFNVVKTAHLELVEKVLSTAKAAGVPVGIHAADAVFARKWANSGFAFVTATSDVTLLKQGAKEVIEAIYDNGGPSQS